MKKFIEELGCELSQRELQIWEGRSGLPEAEREKYIRLWRRRGKGEPLSVARTASPVAPHRVRGTTAGGCGGCGGSKRKAQEKAADEPAPPSPERVAPVGSVAWLEQESGVPYRHFKSKPPTVVYHIAGMGSHWQEIVTEQMGQLAECGLGQVLITHVGEGQEWVLDEARRHGIKVYIAAHHDSLNQYEKPAMLLIEQLARNSDDPILYLHSKGVSHPLTEPVWHQWRRLMMQHTVMAWRENLELLTWSEAVGANWWSDPKGHFSGNFWLARAEWIRQLPKFAVYYKDRYSCERWIGATPGCRAYSHVCKDKKFWAEDAEWMLEQVDPYSS